MPEGRCDPVASLRWNRLLPGPEDPVERGAHARAGLLAGFVTPRGSHAGAACS